METILGIIKDVVISTALFVFFIAMIFAAMFLVDFALGSSSTPWFNGHNEVCVTEHARFDLSAKTECWKLGESRLLTPSE